MLKQKLFLGSLSSIGILIITIGNPSNTYAQVIGENRSVNSIPLSQQALQEMNQGGSSVVGGSMQMLSVKNDVTSFSPLENINAVLNWISGKSVPNSSSQGLSLQATDNAIAGFKTQQKQKLSNSISPLSTPQPYLYLSVK